MKLIFVITLVSVILSPPSGAFAETREECTQTLLKAQQAGFIYGYGMINGVPTVAVDEPTYRGIPFNTKMGIVDLVNCAVAGPGKVLDEIIFISNTSGRVLGHWSMARGLEVY